MNAWSNFLFNQKCFMKDAVALLDLHDRFITKPSPTYIPNTTRIVFRLHNPEYVLAIEDGSAPS